MRVGSLLLILLLIALILFIGGIIFVTYAFKKASSNYIKYSTYPVVMASGLALHYYSLTWYGNELQFNAIPIELINIPQMNLFRQKNTTKFSFGMGIPLYPDNPSINNPVKFTAFNDAWFFSLVPLNDNIFSWELSNGNVTYSLSISAQNQLIPVLLNRGSNTVVNIELAKVQTPIQSTDWYTATDLNINSFTSTPSISISTSIPPIGLVGNNSNIFNQKTCNC